MFQLNTKYHYIIYGMGKKGLHIAEILENNHFNVKYFVDMNASDIKIESKTPILSPNDLRYIKEKNSYIVIISFENALEHDKITRNLNDIGFNNILFFPMFFPNEEVNNVLRETLNKLFDGVVSSKLLYEYNELSTTDNVLNSPKADEKIVISIPFEYLYTDNIVYPSKDIFSKKRIHLQKKYTDIPLLFFRPYFEMFHYLDNGIGNCFEYIQMQLKGNKDYSSQVSKIISDRKKLLNLYNLKFNDLNSMQFFLGSASEAVWNTKGYFNLKDGHHRACYLLYKGLTNIPVRIKYTDFKIFLNYLEQSKNIIDCSINNQYRIYHPFCNNEIDTGLEYKVLKFISFQFNFNDLVENKVLLSTKHNKYLGIVLSKFLNQHLHIKYSVVDDLFRQLTHILKVSPTYIQSDEFKYKLTITDSIEDIKINSFGEQYIYIHDNSINFNSDQYTNIKLLFQEFDEKKTYNIYYIKGDE